MSTFQDKSSNYVKAPTIRYPQMNELKNFHLSDSLKG